MSKFDVDSIKSMTMTDDGIQFELDESDEEEKESGADEEEEETEGYELADDEDGSEEEEEEKPSRSQSKSDDAVEARFTRIENLIEKMTTAIVAGRGKAKEADEEEEDLDLDDPKNLLTTIEKRVAKIIDNRLAPHQDAMQAATVRQQFDSAAAKYGQTFVDAAPMVARLMLASKGTLSVEEAYSNLKENGLIKSSPKKTKQQIVKERKEKKVDADDEEVVTTGNRVPLRKKGRSVKESAMEALKRLSRGELA